MKLHFHKIAVSVIANLLILYSVLASTNNVTLEITVNKSIQRIIENKSCVSLEYVITNKKTNVININTFAPRTTKGLILYYINDISVNHNLPWFKVDYEPYFSPIGSKIPPYSSLTNQVFFPASYFDSTNNGKLIGSMNFFDPSGTNGKHDNIHSQPIVY